jgi:hypothetical protein
MAQSHRAEPTNVAHTSSIHVLAFQPLVQERPQLSDLMLVSQMHSLLLWLLMAEIQ